MVKPRQELIKVSKSDENRSASASLPRASSNYFKNTIQNLQRSSNLITSLTQDQNLMRFKSNSVGPSSKLAEGLNRPLSRNNSLIGSVKDLVSSFENNETLIESVNKYRSIREQRAKELNDLVEKKNQLHLSHKRRQEESLDQIQQEINRLTSINHESNRNSSEQQHFNQQNSNLAQVRNYGNDHPNLSTISEKTEKETSFGHLPNTAMSTNTITTINSPLNLNLGSFN